MVHVLSTGINPSPAHTHARRRLGVTYGLMSLLGALAVMTYAAVFLRWPLGVKLGCALLCLVIAVGALAFVALTAGLKVGSDACTNVEAFVLTQLGDGNVQLVARYWLYDEGSLTAVTDAVFGVDLDATASQVEASRDSVLQALADLTLRQGLQLQVNATLSTVDDIVAGIDDFGASLAYTSFHPGTCVSLCVCLCACVLACVCACVLVCVCTCVRVLECVCVCVLGEEGVEVRHVRGFERRVALGRPGLPSPSTPPSIPLSLSVLPGLPRSVLVDQVVCMLHSHELGGTVLAGPGAGLLRWPGAVHAVLPLHRHHGRGAHRRRRPPHHPCHAGRPGRALGAGAGARPACAGGVPWQPGGQGPRQEEIRRAAGIHQPPPLRHHPFLVRRGVQPLRFECGQACMGVGGAGCVEEGACREGEERGGRWAGLPKCEREPVLEDGFVRSFVGGMLGEEGALAWKGDGWMTAPDSCAAVLGSSTAVLKLTMRCACAPSSS